MKEFWNSRFSEEGYAYGTLPNDFLVEQFSSIPQGGKVLCVCEGEGRNALFLAHKGYEVTAVDFSEVGLKKAQQRAQTEGVALTTITSDLETFDLGENRWDGIVSIFGHLPPIVRKRVHQKIAHALRPGGIFLLEAYTPKQLQYQTGGPKDETLLLTTKILQDEIYLLKTKILREVLRQIQEGKYHHGMSAVIQYLGQKQT